MNLFLCFCCKQEIKNLFLLIYIIENLYKI
nr:MAG TPA: hypothetical protein [Caudoviricetes sp.]